jgi:hypothetical protein
MNVIDRAQKAERILNDPTYQESFELVRQALLAKFEAAPLTDAEGIQMIRLCMKLLKDVKANLDTAVQDGKLAAFEIEEKKRVANFADFNSNPRFRR